MIQVNPSEPCQPGTYKTFSDNTCVPCDTVHYSNEPGATKCYACEAGKEANEKRIGCGKSFSCSGLEY